MATLGWQWPRGAGNNLEGGSGAACTSNTGMVGVSLGEEGGWGAPRKRQRLDED